MESQTFSRNGAALRAAAATLRKGSRHPQAILLFNRCGPEGRAPGQVAADLPR